MIEVYKQEVKKMLFEKPMEDAIGYIPGGMVVLYLY